MDLNQDPGWLSPSGSGAYYDEQPWTFENTFDDNFDTEHFDDDVYTSAPLEDLDYDEEALISSSMATNAFGTDTLPHGQLMSAKVPPAWDGSGSWFAYEEMVEDWRDITTLDNAKQGPALKSRLSGDALVYKPMLSREMLRNEDTGVEYFLKTLRPNFVKGVQNVFLYRLMQFLNQRRNRLDIHRWIAKYELQKKRLMDAWMDLLVPIQNAMDPRYNYYHEQIPGYCRTQVIDEPQSNTQAEFDMIAIMAGYNH